MTRIVMVIGALLAGLLTIPALPQVAVADTNCPNPVTISQGSGTVASPYEISVPGHLQTLRDMPIVWNKYFILTTDIDMSSNASPCAWTSAIGNSASPFTGQLDGGGHVISGLNINVVGTTEMFVYAGLVGYLSGPGVVTRIGFTGDVNATNSGGSFRFASAGGLVGFAGTNAAVSFSYSTGAVTAQATSTNDMATARVGGLVGWTDGASIRDSYSTGNSSGTGSTPNTAGAKVGGLVGASVVGSVTRTFSTGTSTGTAANANVGGFVGDIYQGSISSNFWDTTSSSRNSGAGTGGFTGIVGKTTAQMQSFGTFDDSSWPIVRGWQPFDIASNKVWGICEGVTRPFLLWQYAANPCVASPGPPTITGVTPSGTTAAVDFTADDSGGATITRIEFALDDTTAVDHSTTNVSSPANLSGLTMSTNYIVYMRAVNSQGAGPWSAPAAFRTQGRPGTPVVSGVTPDVTTASVAFTADDSGGSAILAVQFALDDTTTIDGSSTNVSPISLTSLTSGMSYTIYIRAMNSWGPSPWSSPMSFTTLALPPAPPSPVPPSPPLDVRATAADASLDVTWVAPSSSGSFPVTNYQATTSPGGRSCMTTSTTCTIDGLRNGTAYTVTVRALSGAGWSAASAPSEAVVPRAKDGASLTITGSRGSGAERRLIRVSGISTGLAGERVTLWLSIGGRKASQASATVRIQADGTFTWSRKLNRAAVIYAEAGGVRSNAIRLPAVR